MFVRDIMTSPAITVTAATHIPEVARLLRAHQISGLPVLDDNGALLGIVTDHDLILRNAPVREPRYFAILSGYIPLNLEEHRHYKEQLRHTMAVTAGDMTEPDIPTVAPETPLEQAMELMLDPKVTMLPVVDEGAVVGVVSRTDLVRLIEKLEGAVDPAAATQRAEAEPVLAGLHEVILYVQEMGAMVRFYRDQLGLHVEEPADLEDCSAENWVVLGTGATKLALHSGGQQRLGEDAPMLVFAVADIAAARGVLIERGVALEEPFEAAPGVLVCHGRDPEGHPLALQER
ncbi:CBS domain-containing protein [Caldilinea sp.]|uniref:CBS domain-containing protein n=1 Tax=Caldilinea sp. TaxID=2293560 RepID=UPI002C84F5C0|nr:CBS domain-containing protein [Caldilinea sp.]HRA67074.1 CBS domain-containing protein [Caldilinea sp.]